ncbi:hypothetical protein Tco_1327914 [Tanacetum coccineum]
MVKTGLVEAIDSLVPLDEHLATFRGTDIQEKDEKQSQKRQNQARDGKDKVKSKPKSVKALIDRGVAAAMTEAEASRVRNGYDSNGSGPRPAQAIRECSYSEFLKYKPFDFKVTEGVTTTPEVAHAMPWATLKKMMTGKYCSRGKIKKIETEMWNLKVKGTDVVAYIRRF